MTCANAMRDTQVWTALDAYVCLERPGGMRLSPTDTHTTTLNAPGKGSATEKLVNASAMMASLVTGAGTLPAPTIAMAMEPQQIWTIAMDASVCAWKVIRDPVVRLSPTCW